MAVSKRTRFEVLKRDNHTCRYCGTTAEDGPITWADAMRRAAEALAGQGDAIQAYLESFHDAWPQYRYLPDGAEAGVRRLYEAGLPEEQMADAARIATSQRGIYDRFAYFMGICWKRVTEIQEAAKQILAAEDGATD